MQANLSPPPIAKACSRSYVERLLPLYCGSGFGEACQLEVRELPADAYLQNQCWEEMLMNFEVAVMQTSMHLGPPAVRIRDGQPETAIWEQRTSLTLNKLVAWQNENQYFYIALESKPGHAIRLMSGRI